MKEKKKTLEQLREEMDVVDEEIIQAFRNRMRISSEIAKYKKENGLSILDIDREKSKLDRIVKNDEDDLAAFTSKLYLVLADLSKEYQTIIYNKED
ncbi:MAG TPA: chorismate mutase [Mogibacterium sp.]|nr:chorismate mutase [Mogibacterium sp.]